MSLQGLSKIVNLRSPSDFLGAVMKGSGKAYITREDVLGALSNHKDKLGQSLLYYWLYEDGGRELFEHGKDAAIGYALAHKDGIIIDRDKIHLMAQGAIIQCIKYHDTKKIIAWVNGVTTKAITMTPHKYRGQISFMIDLHTLFNNSLFKAKMVFLSHFDGDE